MARQNLASILFFGSLWCAAPAVADDNLRVIAQSGDWAAIAHSSSLIAAPDMCGALTSSGALLFRADGDTIEIRVSDKDWSLPANVEGMISLTVGDWRGVWPVSSNNSNQVSGIVTPEDAVAMFGAMDKAGTMTVAVGKAKPRTISLAGSTKVTNAFRTCAGIKGNDGTAGANPFR